ncbi:acyltransferase family protein [Yersinia kristensenii]|uniref:acyltransferase family protein n=1 Tax=Yersinia kristensenii TaxID=28152 RepID=UPI0005E5F81A|nr:acyltransferase family protein [Yersinia kristensenii]CNG62755.1 acyltransferase family protein [Yersinia kristensenii]CNK69449.1 acyltransferase family protein [Yersinia kristensenii]
MELRYRPDIDGLRALAVLLVIVYHVGSQVITGGFVGVDIFFVISGYLITSIIRKEISNGSFTYSGFYNRRIKRILPSLLVVLFSTIVSSIFILMPDEFTYLIKSAIATLLSVSNFLFYFNSTSYFSGNTDQIPLLHTWSLSVEEQYYLIVPLLISFVIVRFKKYELQVFAVIVIALFVVSQYGAITNASLSYYMLPFRAFELMIGGVVSILLSQYKFESYRLSNTLSILGIVFIVFSSLAINKQSLFPGYNALIPCLGAAMIIISGANQAKTPIANRLLTLKPVVFIGKISYSMYLWHWPIIALLNYRGIEFTLPLKIGIVLLTILLSMLNYYIFENRIRKLNIGFMHSLVSLLLLPLVIFTFIYILTIAFKGFPERFNNNDFANDNRADVKYYKCYDSYILSDEGICIIGDVTKKPETIMIGDSIAGSYIEFIDYLAKDAGKSIAVTVSSSLPPIMNINPYREGTSVSKYRSEEKLSYNNKRIDLAKGYKNVIIGASWGNDNSYFKANGYDILSTLEYISSHGSKIIVILRPNGMDYKEFSKFKADIASGTDDHSDLAKKTNVNIALDGLLNSYEEPVYIDPNDSLCTDSGCKVYLNGRFIYMDHAHLNVYGARELAKVYLKNHKNPFL